MHARIRYDIVKLVTLIWSKTTSVRTWLAATQEWFIAAAPAKAVARIVKALTRSFFGL